MRHFEALVFLGCVILSRLTPSVTVYRLRHP